MKQFALTVVLMAAPALVGGCGSTEDGDRATPSDAGSDSASGTGGSTSQGDSSVADSGAPACPDGSAWPPTSALACASITRYPVPQSDAQAASPPCETPASFDPVDPYHLQVFVDCIEVPACGNAELCWDIDEDGGTPVIRLSDALCAQMEESGYTRLDLVQECVY